MPRKKQPSKTTTAPVANGDAATAVAASSATATAELPPEPSGSAGGAAGPPAPPTTARPHHSVAAPAPQAAPATSAAEKGGKPEGRTWAVPYQSLFISDEKGFEMGENRRFKQRVFLFKDKPEEHVRAALKEHGFVYRPVEKAWTITATAQNRVLSEHLAKVFAGQSQGMSR